MKTALILLAGGKGTRLGGLTPKQFLPLGDLPIVLHSLNVFGQIQDIQQIIVVADLSYQSLFPAYQLALPGIRRQDSVWNGLQKVDPSIEMVCIHDAARPFIDVGMVQDLLSHASSIGAAALAVPVKSTIKEASFEGNVIKTLNRAVLWEIQTPQALRKEILVKGFALADHSGITVTDDVSLAELLGCPVKLVLGKETNIKITTKEDLALAYGIQAHHRL